MAEAWVVWSVLAFWPFLVFLGPDGKDNHNGAGMALIFLSGASMLVVRLSWPGLAGASRVPADFICTGVRSV